MRNLPVHWHEGMFLRPHQFQAADRYWAETLQTSQQMDHGYGYGLRSVEISSEAIANYQFQLTSVRARLRDGTLLDLQAGQEPDRVELREALESDAVVRVFLAVPKLRLGQANVGGAGSETVHRYVESMASLQDESSGGNDQELSLRDLRVRLLLSTDDHSGYELLPVAQVRRSGEGDAVPVLDREYYPPLLAVDAWHDLAMETIRAIYDLIGNRVTVLSQHAVDRGISMASPVPGDLSLMMMLSVLNASYASVGCLTFARGVHPFTAYSELCRIVGTLSVFGADRRVDEIPVYDHDDLARIFAWLKRQIIELMNAVELDRYEQRFFEGVGRGMQVALERRWFDPDWNWYVGVHPEGISAEECRELLSPGKLNWKMGSSRMVDDLFERRAEGVKTSMPAQTPRALPAGGGWVYYEVDRDSVAWLDVQSTQTLAVRFTEELIGNLDSLPGERTLQVVAGEITTQLQFALFAVPSQSRA